MKFYGLKNCDTCRKAMKELDAASVIYDYVDVRADGVPEAVLAGWLKTVDPAALVNRRSTTWRSLSDAEKKSAEISAQAVQLLLKHPTLMKRPVVRLNDGVFIGWTPATRSAAGL